MDMSEKYHQTIFQQILLKLPHQSWAALQGWREDVYGGHDVFFFGARSTTVTQI